jgi:hypothetical protein
VVGRPNFAHFLDYKGNAPAMQQLKALDIAKFGLFPTGYMVRTRVRQNAGGAWQFPGVLANAATTSFISQAPAGRQLAPAKFCVKMARLCGR